MPTFGLDGWHHAAMEPSANWYPDPTRRHELRYWDGERWTEHVSDSGTTATDPVDSMDRLDAALTVDDASNPDSIRRQVSDGGFGGAGLGDVKTGGGTVFTEPVLVVNQRAKLIELAAQYGVFDGQGAQLATVSETGQSTLKKAVRLISDLDQYMTHTYELRDRRGALLLSLTRPRKLLKSSIVVGGSDGREIGRIVQENVIGKINFGLHTGSTRVGAIKAENWRAWNFRIEDSAGREVARITKTFEGVLKTMFTTADNYVVQIHEDVPQPLRSLVVAAAVSVDTALKQDQRGLN